MYTKDESEIVSYIENENPKSMSNLADKMDKIKLAITTKYANSKVNLPKKIWQH